MLNKLFFILNVFILIALAVFLLYEKLLLGALLLGSLLIAGNAIRKVGKNKFVFHLTGNTHGECELDTIKNYLKVAKEIAESLKEIYKNHPVDELMKKELDDFIRNKVRKDLYY